MADYPEYAARLEIDYPEKLDRLTTFFRLIWIIPIAIILGLISGSGETITNTVTLNEAGEVMRTTRETVGGLASGFAAATARRPNCERENIIIQLFSDAHRGDHHPDSGFSVRVQESGNPHHRTHGCTSGRFDCGTLHV